MAGVEMKEVEGAALAGLAVEAAAVGLEATAARGKGRTPSAIGQPPPGGRAFRALACEPGFAVLH